MSQIERKWIADGAINNAKIDHDATYEVGGLYSKGNIGVIDASSPQDHLHIKTLASEGSAGITLELDGTSGRAYRVYTDDEASLHVVDMDYTATRLTVREGASPSTSRLGVDSTIPRDVADFRSTSEAVAVRLDTDTGSGRTFQMKSSLDGTFSIRDLDSNTDLLVLDPLAAATIITGDLTVTGGATVSGDFEVSGDATVGTDIQVNGDSRVNGNSNVGIDLDVVRDATIGNNILVRANSDFGSSNLHRHNFTGDFRVYGDAIASNLSVVWDASIGRYNTGYLEVNGNTSILGNVITVGDGTFQDLRATRNISAAGDGTFQDLRATRNIRVASGAAINSFDTNVSLGTSNTALPTQGAVKSYVDSAVGGISYWNRAGTTLSPATAGDSISATGDVTSRRLYADELRGTNLNLYPTGSCISLSTGFGYSLSLIGHQDTTIGCAFSPGIIRADNDILPNALPFIGNAGLGNASWPFRHVYTDSLKADYIGSVTTGSPITVNADMTVVADMNTAGRFVGGMQKDITGIDYPALLVVGQDTSSYLLTCNDHTGQTAFYVRGMRGAGEITAYARTTTGVAIQGSTDGGSASAIGVNGISGAGSGVYGYTNTGAGVRGEASGSGIGIDGTTGAGGTAVRGTAGSGGGYGVAGYGVAATTSAVYAFNEDGRAVYAATNGNSADAVAVEGHSQYTTAGKFITSGTTSVKAVIADAATYAIGYSIGLDATGRYAGVVGSAIYYGVVGKTVAADINANCFVGMNNAGNIVFKVTYEGEIYSEKGAYVCSGADFAEWCRVDGDYRDIDLGTVVAQSEEKDMAVVKATDSIYGIATDRATFCGGLPDAEKGDMAKLTKEEMEIKYNARRIALVGHVLCKVTGKIKRNDKLVLSDIPGVARAAQTSLEKAMTGMVARQIYDSDDVGLIEILMR